MNGTGRSSCIVQVEAHEVALPPRRAHRWASLTAPIGTYVLVSVTLDDGTRGWGEATALAQWGGPHGRHYGEDATTVVHLLDRYWSPLLLGSDPADHRGTSAAMTAAVRGYPFARSAVICALVGARAASLGIPVADLLGGRRRTSVRIAHSLGLMADDEIITEARAAVAEGVRTLKVKAGEDPARDVRVVVAVRDAVGPDIEIGVDANEGWGDVHTALRAISAMGDADIRYIEQPVPGVASLQQVAARSSIPVMADESVWTAPDVLALGGAGHPLLASIYLGKSGGIMEALRVDAAADLLGVGTNVNGSAETGVGNLANLHLAAAMASLREASVFPVSSGTSGRSTTVAAAMYLDDVLAEPMGWVDGAIPVPTGPGLGIEIDEDKVAALSIGHHRWSAEEMADMGPG